MIRLRLSNFGSVVVVRTAGYFVECFSTGNGVSFDADSFCFPWRSVLLQSTLVSLMIGKGTRMSPRG